MENNNRRQFLKISLLSGAGIGISGSRNILLGTGRNNIFNFENEEKIKTEDPQSFMPQRVASWWCTLDDILWPQKAVKDKIKKRAEAFSKAEIDTAISFGFHARFDFSDYFGKLNGYFADVCEELHRYNIRFLDHYSCNNVERPRGEEEMRKLNRNQRHHVLLYPDPIAASHAQYEGQLFHDICEVDLRNGKRGYAPQYQFETFCHNNPAFLSMHRKYLQRYLEEVPVDGFQIDDMCDYAGLTTCGCKYCRERFKKDYGGIIPPFGEKSFWGNTNNKNRLMWGNYDNPAFRDWLRMKSDSIVDHLKMIKSVIKEKPLMTCCSSAGPIILNAISLNLEAMAPELNWFMLENVGINVRSIHWMRMDPEALIQKDVARQKGNVPALALSYTIYEKGGYLGWSLARYWGVANWSSTLNGRLVEDPPDAMEIENIIRPYNQWEISKSNLSLRQANDLVEIRLVTSRDCRENGWRNNKGREQWDAVKDWSAALVKKNIGYRMVRSEELADKMALKKESTPLILDNVGCISNDQWEALNEYIKQGGITCIRFPFGIQDEKGNSRKIPLEKELKKMKYKNLIFLSENEDPLAVLIRKSKFKPVITQLEGDDRWKLRIRFYENKPVIHLLNAALAAVPHETLKDISGTPVLKDILSDSKDNNLLFEVNTSLLPLPELKLLSPEWGTEEKTIQIEKINSHTSHVRFNLEGIKIYAVAQSSSV